MLNPSEIKEPRSLRAERVCLWVELALQDKCQLTGERKEGRKRVLEKEWCVQKLCGRKKYI